MKRKSLMRRLIDGIRGKLYASPTPQLKMQDHTLEIPLDDPRAVKEILESDAFKLSGGDPRIAEVLRQIGNAIPSIRSDKPITIDQIQIDSAALLVMFMTSGYEPLQILYLMTKLYGSLMASAPYEIGTKEDGTKITVDLVEKDFFNACVHERKHFKNIHDTLFGGNDNILGKGTLH